MNRMLMVVCGLVLTWEACPPARAATPPSELRVKEGFRVELLHEVDPEREGSWINLTVDPRGRLVVSDQYGALHRVTPSPAGQPLASNAVERLDLPLGGAHGLLFAHGALYVMCGQNQFGKPNGVYRVTDADGDDRPDHAELIMKLEGGGEHGPHALVAGPDGQSIYVLAGNHTPLPAALAGSLLARPWGEDQVLPELNDPGGHAVGIKAPGGWIARMDPDGSNVVLVSAGYRNAFDMAFNADGELFTYDADMEWDFGAPWYRPTRVCHAVSGSDFGWRTGSGKWPAYYADSLPALHDIGPGSPCGVLFGYGAHFPEAYQRALYLLDWTFGALYALHLEPAGATWTGRREEIVTGKGLPLTDAAVGTDGALYFITGGRKLQSGLYRLTWTNGPVAPLPPADFATASPERALRKTLESFHGRVDPAAVDAAWPHLGHPDRFIRHAARVAIEHQPAASWAERALDEPQPGRRVRALLALARQGEAMLRERALAALLDCAPAPESAGLLIDWLRAVELVCIRMGDPPPAARGPLLARLEALYPAAGFPENRELSRLLVRLESPVALERTLVLMERGARAALDYDRAMLDRSGYGNAIKAMLANPPAAESLHYAMVLRGVRAGWTPDQRRRYFTWLLEAGRASGGHSYAGYLQAIRREALAGLDETARLQLGALAVEQAPRALPPFTPARGPGRAWTVDQAAALAAGGWSNRNFESGRNLFRAGLCVACHRVRDEGGSVGPDLTQVGTRFTPRDLLTAIIDPSKEVVDQYAWTTVRRRNGELVHGRLVADDTNGVALAANPYDPGQVTKVKRHEVASVGLSTVSPMPPGLINAMNEQELLDLLAFLIAGGDAKSELFGEEAGQ